MEKRKELDLDEVLQELGQFGKYQFLVYGMVLPAIMFSAVYNAQYIFNAGAADHRCKVPECETSPASFEPGSWGAWALPESGGRCERLRPLAATCGINSFHTNDTVTCTQWVYEHHNTIVAEFDLACEEWKRTLVGTVHSAGLFFALPMTGYISDTYGRRTAFIITAVSAGAMGLIRSFSVNYIMYLVFEFLDAVLGSGIYSTGFILALEMVGLKRRVIGGNIISSSFALGQVVLALIAWQIPHWRTLTRVIYTPSLLFIFYYFILEESVRWLISKGRKEEAARIIFKAAAINGKKLSPETNKILTEDIQSSNPDVVVSENDRSRPSLPKDVEEKPLTEPSLLMQVLRSRIIMSRLAICSFWWITVTFIYYGLSINSVSLGGNMYLNYIFTSLVEIPGYCLSVLTLDRFGRKSSIMTSYFICGVSLFSLPFVPSTLLWLQTCLNLVGKMAISMVFSSIYIYTSELFPTRSRHSLLGFCSMIGRIGSIVAPQTPLLMVYMESLPYLLFGIMAAIAGLLMTLTPETLHMRLPDTIKQAEEMAQAPRDT